MHGRNLDEPVRIENLAFYPGAGTYWFQQSTLGNVAAIADSSGAIIERYTYDAYGLPQFETPANVAKAVTASDFGNPYLFHARRFEPALYPLYDFRARFLDPTRGRFVQRDPPGVWHDPLNLGGAQAFVADSPINLTDPMGRDVLTVALGAAASGGTLAKVAAGAAAVAGSPVALGVVTTAAVIAGGYYIYRRWFADPPTAEGGGGGGGGTTRGTPSTPSAPSVPATPATPAAPAAPSSPGTPRLDPGLTLTLAQSGLAHVVMMAAVASLWGPAVAESLSSSSSNNPGASSGRPPRVKPSTLRRRWEQKHNKPWPKDKDGKNQDVSHKEPLADGGSNDVDNLEPLPHEEHMRRHLDNGDFTRWGGRSCGG